MGQSREMIMEIERLQLMKEKGVINDYMKLELIKGLSNSNFPPMQMYAMQMLGGMKGDLPDARSQLQPAPSVSTSRSPAVLPDHTSASANDGTRLRKPGEISTPEGTMIQKSGRAAFCLLNLATQALHPLEKEVINIGRSPSAQGATNDIIVNDNYISRNHVQLVISESGEVVAINVSASNSLMINDTRKVDPGERWPIQPNDILEIGYTKFKLIKN
jgi:hypothetical protein